MIAILGVVVAVGACNNPPANLDARTPANSPGIIKPLHMLVRPQYAPDVLWLDAPGVWNSSRCSSGATGGINLVSIYLSYHYQPTTSQTFNCRNVDGTNSMSAHGVGRAVDLFFNANDAAQRRRADDMVFMLLASDAVGNPNAIARRMGIQTIIWNRRIWTANNAAAGMRTYTGKHPHTDHVHIEINNAAALQGTTFFKGWHVLSCAPDGPCGYISIGRYAS